jgi:hypothetical protein
MRYDIENFFDDLKAFLQANMNTKLAAIDAEKADGITLGTISNAAYFFQTLGDEIANYNPFVFYGIDQLPANAIYSNVDAAITAQVVIVLSDDENDPNIMKRLLRYQRALIELFESNYAGISKIGKILVSGLAPAPLALAGRAGLDRVIGVNLEVHLP